MHDLTFSATAVRSVILVMAVALFFSADKVLRFLVCVLCFFFIQPALAYFTGIRSRYANTSWLLWNDHKGVKDQDTYSSCPVHRLIHVTSPPPHALAP